MPSRVKAPSEMRVSEADTRGEKKTNNYFVLAHAVFACLFTKRVLNLFPVRSLELFI